MKGKALYISIVVMITGGTAVFFLSTIPFGVLFKLSVMTFFIGGLVTFLLLSISLVNLKPVWKKMLAIPVFCLFLLMGFVAVCLGIDNAKSYTRLANACLKIMPEQSKGAFTSFPYSLTRDEWKKDLDYLKEELPKHHANLFLYLKREVFFDAIAKLEAKLDKLSGKEVAFEICRIISMVKDGHTQMVSVVFNMPTFLDSRLFPLRIFHFNDGVFVTDGGRDNKELKGLRISKIGETKMEDVIKMIDPFVPGENSYYKMQWDFPYLLNAELLKYSGIIPGSGSAIFTFADSSGKEIKKTLKPVLSPLYLRWFRETQALDDISRKGNQKRNYWFEYDRSAKTIFFQLNMVNNQPGELSLKDFAQQLTDVVDQNEVDCFIIDMRNCNGGDNSRMGPLVDFLSNNIKINQHGKLFTIIGRQTFSGGVSFIAALERNTKAIFAGEPAGSGPNQCGDVQTFILPKSRLVMQVSSKYHQQSFYKDHRLQITPSVPVAYNYKNWNENIDPAMIAIRAYKRPATLPFFGIDTTSYTAYSGRYSFDADKILTIKTELGKLVYEIKDYTVFARNELDPAGVDWFMGNNGLISMKFLSKNNKQFQKIFITWAGATDTLLRLQDDFLSPAELVQEGKFSDVVKAYRKIKSKNYVFAAATEAGLNSEGYRLMEQNKPDEAIELFTINTELFPFSGNAWDSLAEAWLKKGDKEKAKIFYTKSLEMNPENNGAKDALKSILN